MASSLLNLEQPLFFAPMEGITDECFRLSVLELFGDWDYYFTDFLRLSASGLFPKKKIISHLGEEVYLREDIKQKTIFQIMFSEKSLIIDSLKQIEDLGIPWIDLNFGCPSNTVCKNGGGSSWLQEPEKLLEVVHTIRTNFKGKLSIKTRLGFNHPNEFEFLIKNLNSFDLEMITIHGRTRAQMYKEPANWSYIKKAVEISNTPIIGNGDIWSHHDIQQMFQLTGCFGVMGARGALQTPWMASLYKNNHLKDSPLFRITSIIRFYESYSTRLMKGQITQKGLLKQLKSIARLMFNPLANGLDYRTRLQHQSSPNEFMTELYKIKNEIELITLSPERSALLNKSLGSYPA